MATWMAFIIAGILIIGWPISIAINWKGIVDNDTRLGYLIADLGVVFPLFLISGIGLSRGRLFGSLLFLVAIGAVTYDSVHFTVYLIKIGYLSIPVYVYLLILAVFLVVFFILARQRMEYILDRAGDSN